MFDQQCALTRHKPLCLEEQFDFGFIYLTLNQTKTDCFAYRNFLFLKEREPENSKLQSYLNYSNNVSLIPSMTEEKCAAIKASAHKQN